MNPDPFGVLGLPSRPGLTDDEVRAAWRRVAAATHPDRADGGDPARFAAAAAAYTELRTSYGRGEAYADRVAGHRRRAAPAGPVPRRDTTQRPEAAPHPESAHRESTGPGDSATHRESAPHPDSVPRVTAAGLTGRIRRGRPALLALRIVIAAAITAAAFAALGAQPAAGALAVGALTWLLLTARHDLAPPPR